MVETFTAAFFFLSFRQHCCLGKSQIAGAFSQSSFKRRLKLSRFVHLGFCHRVGTTQRNERIRCRHELVLDQKKFNQTTAISWKSGGIMLKVEAPSAATLQRLQKIEDWTNFLHLILFWFLDLNPAWIVTHRWLYKPEGNAASNPR